ncbi:Lactosylceramide 1,3-N-acetyl-beta-D-glucosaminyltransferase A [Pseudolycoriella hygida]|uniref:Hexosyltransferase n=1 Tax=Pseudolycoriella hygida TaxID=35572 RepID=A0A9Q0RSY9_9DIPT|nr:Lactosylceramide 1,3-N-acetyl-beta-D-glucosaminyltransferase A [Pseudolycoriella hygida]
MPRKLCKIKHIFVTTLALFVVILIYILFYENFNDEDEFIIVKAIEPYDDDEISPSNLVNFTNFQYKIKPDSLCNNFEDDLLGVLIVTSYVGHDEVRSAHRQALTQQKLQSLGLLRVFLLADIPPSERFIQQKSIYDESDRFEDIIQGNFHEAYRNLTYKHVMGLRWAASECSFAKYIIKLDDDTVFDVFHLVNYLENIESTVVDVNAHLLAGYILDGKKPIRLQASKWYVTFEEYGEDIYPDYLSGWLYITNPQTARSLVAESQSQSYFWIDDTWVTGVLRQKRNISLTRLNKWFSANSQFLDCCVSDVRRHSFKCDYHVGPNGGDVKLIKDFMNAMENCYENECFERTSEQSVKETCVGHVKNIIGQHGAAVVKSIKL